MHTEDATMNLMNVSPFQRRPPTMNSNIFAFAWTLPFSYKINNCSLDRILLVLRPISIHPGVWNIVPYFFSLSNVSVNMLSVNRNFNDDDCTGMKVNYSDDPCAYVHIYSCRSTFTVISCVYTSVRLLLLLLSRA